MDVGLMVEGQNGLTWERWARILRTADRLGFRSLFRSDHYFIGRQSDSLEAYLSFVMAARETSRIRFGPLVTPVTFRAPVDVGRMAAQIDVLSGGRFVMGLGAGWNEPEHRAYGIPFPPTGERFERLAEAIELIHRLWAPGPATFQGRYYTLEGAECLPRPPRRLPLLVGGNGERRTLSLAARYADEWNGFGLGPEAYARRAEALERHCARAGRDPGTIRRSLMAFALAGPDAEALDRVTTAAMDMLGAGRSTTPAEFRRRESGRGFIVGTTEEVVEQLERLAEHGLQEIVLQHVDFDSDELPEYLASEIMPRVAHL